MVELLRDCNAAVGELGVTLRRYALQMMQDVCDTSGITVNPEYEAAIEESYWKSVHGLKKRGGQSDGLAPSWLLENLQGDAWQERSCRALLCVMYLPPVSCVNDINVTDTWRLLGGQPTGFLFCRLTGMYRQLAS